MRMKEFSVASSRAEAPAFYTPPIPPGQEPFPFQLAGVEYHMARDNALYGDEPGLGKTAQCILLGNAIEAKSTLVICPASLRLNWEREIWRWSTIPNVSTYPILKSPNGVSHIANYVITSYDMLRSKAILAALMDKRWDHLVLDEAHALKDPKGNQRTKAICAPDMLPSVCGRITMASGTILPNQPIECYNAIRLLNWEAINKASLSDFRHMYYEEGGGMIVGPVLNQDTQVWERKLHWSTHVLNVPVNMEALQYRLRKFIMVRRLKSDVLTQLPPKAWHPFPLDMTPAIRKALRHEGWVKAERLYDLDPGAFQAVSVDGQIATARRLLGEAKAPVVAAYIEELLNEGVDKVVVSAYHTSVLAILRERLGRFGLVFMDGSTPMKRRQLAVDSFNADPAIRVILGQSQPLGEGWTLTASQDVVLAEPDWVPGRNEQVVDRVHRIGQRGHVLGHVPVVPNTLDERILGTVVAKSQNIHAALDKQ